MWPCAGKLASPHDISLNADYFPASRQYEKWIALLVAATLELRAAAQPGIIGFTLRKVLFTVFCLFSSICLVFTEERKENRKEKKQRQDGRNEGTRKKGIEDRKKETMKGRVIRMKGGKKGMMKTK